MAEDRNRNQKLKISNRFAATHDEKVGSFTGYRDDRKAIGSLFGGCPINRNVAFP
jgi:hypothetical protein